VSSIDLVLLGMLTRHESSAYDLVRLIETYDLSGIVRLSTPSIYKNVKQLLERGYLSAREIRQGEMPEKTLYSVTDNGRDYFFQLMEKYAAEKIRYRFDFNSVIMNLDRVPRKRRERLLALLRERLQNSREETEVFLKAWRSQSPIAQLMINQIELVNQALLVWIDGVVKKL
jgi:DNA-binding PadR family transcriptional regulator